MRIRLSFLTGFVLDGLAGLARDDRAAGARAHAGAARSRGAGPPRRASALAGGRRARGPRALGTARGRSKGSRPRRKALEGRHVGDIAKEQGKAPFDALLDIVIADELRTGLRPDFGGPEPDETWQMRADVWRDPRAMIGGSDSGAHLDMMCGARLLDVRRRRRGPQRLRHDGRGRVPAHRQARRVSTAFATAAASRRAATPTSSCFDPQTVGPAGERTQQDLPGGASRIVAQSHGVEHVLVDGTEIVRDGAYTGATPGTVLRAGRDTETVHAASTEA